MKSMSAFNAGGRLQHVKRWCAVVMLALPSTLLGSVDAAAQTLTENEQSALNAIKVICPKLGALNKVGGLDADEQQLFFRCNTILNTTSGAAAKVGALNAISPEQLNAAPRANIDFGTTQRSNVMSRLLTLRTGQGLGGGSGDESSSLSDGKFGTFFNVKDGFGSKDGTDFESDYKVKSYGATLGADYRVAPSFVVGVALGFGDNKADFSGGGDLKTEGAMGSIYATWYGEHQSLDAVATFGSFDNQSRRLISYTVTSPARTDAINSTADGSTRSHMTAVGLSYAYDLGRGAWTFGPMFNIDYLHVNVQSFAETSYDHPELDLSYGPQHGNSLQLQPGFNVVYNASLPWGVVSPYARAVYVREAQGRQDSFELRYVYDTKVAAQGINTSFVVKGDDPDQDYFRFAAGVSATFSNGFSAFLDSDSLVGFSTVKYTEVTLGVRYQFR